MGMDEVTTAMLSRIEEVEAKDEAQILAEIAGETISELIYWTEIEDRKTKQLKKVPRLSYKGVMQVTRDRGNLMVDEKPADITESDKDWRIVIRVVDLKRNFALFGGSHQPKTMKVNIYENKKLVATKVEDDPFAFQKCLAKAQRNAFLKALPESYIANFIGRYLEAQKKRGLLPQGASAETQKPPADKLRIPKSAEEITVDQVQTLHQLETLAYNRWHLQPDQMYKELGYKGKADCTETPFDCFLKLKAVIEG